MAVCYYFIHFVVKRENNKSGVKIVEHKAAT